MTRLIKEDICEIENMIETYDKLFKDQTGKTMDEIAKAAAGLRRLAKHRPVSVIPVTSGLGIIDTFADMVAVILKYIKVDAKSTEHTDVSGLKEAYDNESKIVFMADDDTFLATSLYGCAMSDNGDATGRGFATALLEAMRYRKIDPQEQKILILGAGPVGSAAVETMIDAKAVPVVYDPDTEKLKQLKQIYNDNVVCLEVPPQYIQYRFILDASTAGDIIGEDDVTGDTVIAAPGMPCAATREACQKACVIHNPLELGVITMYYQVIAQIQKSC